MNEKEQYIKDITICVNNLHNRLNGLAEVYQVDKRDILKIFIKEKGE